MKAKSKEERLSAERERLAQMRRYEEQYSELAYIGGVDEAGRGPLAGPVVAACVVLPHDAEILYLNDSKKLSEKRREALYEEIKQKALGWGLGIVDAARIDELNILQATYEAMRQAVNSCSTMLGTQPDLLLNDAVQIPGLSIAQLPLVHGDALSLSIAAASILAKVTRDRMMCHYEQLYPGYGFAGHKGYGTKAHNEAILALGPCPIHRSSFLRKLYAAHPEKETGKLSPQRRDGYAEESRACAFLESLGYVLLERNYRFRHLELDLIMRDKESICFVEVKSRAGAKFGSGAEAVDAAKQQRLRTAAAHYLSTQQLNPQETPCRFDVLSLDGDKINHYINAF